MNATEQWPPARRVLMASLCALVARYVIWFVRVHPDNVALVVFALPPALCALGIWRRARTAGLLSAVLALAWFCHGVMTAWSSADERVLALLETALAVAIVFAASWPGLHARFGRRGS